MNNRKQALRNLATKNLTKEEIQIVRFLNILNAVSLKMNTSILNFHI